MFKTATQTSLVKMSSSRAATRWIFGTMLAFGIVGLLASFVLSVEEIHLIQNPSAALSCSFNLVLNCSDVMKTWQASVFGFPNMFIGLMAFPVVIVAAALGLARVQLPRWFWMWANIGFLGGAIFSYWLFFSSVYVIEVLCPWCLLVTLSTTLLLATVTHFNLKENTFGFAKKTNDKIQAVLKKDFGKLFVASWIVLMAVLVFLKFGADLFA